jgi:hypothetical protein
MRDKIHGIVVKGRSGSSTSYTRAYILHYSTARFSHGFDLNAHKTMALTQLEEPRCVNASDIDRDNISGSIEIGLWWVDNRV